MATIHHATLKSAAAEGIELTKAGLTIRAFAPRLGRELFHDGKARDALDQMRDLLWTIDTMQHDGLDYEIVAEGDGSDHDCAAITLKIGERNTYGTPHEVREWFVALHTAASPYQPESEEERLEALAEARGVDVEDIEEAEAAKADEEPEERHSGSVVNDKYRAIYAERGNPAHCGDEMAVWFDTHCANKAGTNVELFVEICRLNGVDLSHLNQTNPGWQGRLRMTGRNMLGRRVWAAKGLMVVPETMGGAKQFGEEWLSTRNYKAPKAPKVAPAPAEAPAA